MRSGAWLRRLGVGIVAAALCSCGVSLDERPRALQVRETTTTVADGPSTGRFQMVLYYVGDGELLPVVRDLPNRALDTVLRAQLEQPTDPSAEQGLASSIPAGTELLGYQRDRNRLAINLSESFDNVVGLSRTQAIGQLVMAVTGLPDIEIVQFRVEGVDVTVSSPLRGDTSSVTACDYLPILATVDGVVDRLDRLPVIAIDELSERTVQLEHQCGAVGPATSTPG